MTRSYYLCWPNTSAVPPFTDEGRSLVIEFYSRLYTRFGREIDGKRKKKEKGTFHRRKWKVNSKMDERLESELVEENYTCPKGGLKNYSGYE